MRGDEKDPEVEMGTMEFKDYINIYQASHFGSVGYGFWAVRTKWKDFVNQSDGQIRIIYFYPSHSFIILFTF